MVKNKLLSKCHDYFDIRYYYYLLRRDWHVSTFLSDVLNKILATLVVSVDRFVLNASAISASALTFYSTLAFIPVFALILAIARGFGTSKALEDWLTHQAYANPDVVEWIMNVASKALDNTQSNIITGLGIIILIWSAVRMLSSTELAMNRIWGVKEGRGIVKKFTDYMSILFIAPILMVLISSINVFMMSSLKEVAMDEGLLAYAGEALIVVLKWAPYVLVWFLFMFLYMFMPTTPVKFKYALVAGVVAGTVFQVIQWFYIKFQIGVTSYNAIYGGFAALPLLLVWLQLSWSVVLWGTELCFIMRNRHFIYRDTMDANTKWVDDVAVALKMLHFIFDSISSGKGAPTLDSICTNLKMSSGNARIVLQELVDQKMLVEVEKEDDVSFYPAVDFHKLSVADIINALANMNEETDESWKKRFKKTIECEFSKDTFA